MNIWILASIVVCLVVIVVGYYKSKGEDALDRPKFLLFVLAGVAVIVVGYYGGSYFTKEPPKQAKISITVGVPKPKAANPATTQPAAAPSLPGAPKPAAAGGIRVMEKGKEVVYASPQDFVARTTLPPSEARAFADRRLTDAKKAEAAARAKGNKAAIDQAAKDVAAAEKLVSLVKSSMVAMPGMKIVPYVSLGRRDPFMSPLEVPKAYPGIPPNAPPLERVPTESLSVKAIVWNAKGFRALLVAPDGRGYTVKVGDRVGDKGGRINKISERRVSVIEKIRDILGDVETRDIVLKLHKEAD